MRFGERRVEGDGLAIRGERLLQAERPLLLPPLLEVALPPGAGFDQRVRRGVRLVQRSERERDQRILREALLRPRQRRLDLRQVAAQLQQPDREQRDQLAGLGAPRDLRIGAGLRRAGERRAIGDARPGDRRACRGRRRQLRLHQIDQLERQLAMRLGDVAAILGLRLDRGVDVQRGGGRHRRGPRLEDALELLRLLGAGAAAVGDAAQHLAGQVAQILAGAIAQAGRRIRGHVGDGLGLIAGLVAGDDVQVRRADRHLGQSGPRRAEADGDGAGEGGERGDGETARHDRDSMPQK